MPTFPVGTITHIRPDSWPPASNRMTPTLEDDNLTDDDDLDLPLLEQDPLRYFLTPPTPQDEDLEFDFDFDAGIEDSSHPQEIVRSVSPSTLGGLKRYKPHNKTNDCAIIDDDSDGDEDYIRFTPSKSFPLSLPDFGFDRPRTPGAAQSRNGETLLPTAFHVGSPRGRPVKRFAPPRRTFQGRSRSVPLQRRHSWREPSPDVWSIEEEPEKETLSERGLSTEDLEAYFQEKKTAPIDIPAAKPKKRVRFVLPEKE
ncbi:hypothetical protein JX265_004110 [Neoarthrinium moseri]|uniref:Uncharacterized protein n=1 Tax=Neoarthrinium moseri TaxID=1658444 RepID=A0A9P9WRQ6_9PEZI|nr:hypothetical protein JX265_004110 [Neoarthrinium moseri]